MSTTKYQYEWEIPYTPGSYRHETGVQFVDVPDWVLDACEANGCGKSNRDDSTCELTLFLDEHLHSSIGSHAYITSIECAE